MVEFSNGAMSIKRTVRVEVEVSGAPRFERAGARHFQECKELIPTSLMITYINNQPRELVIMCSSVRADGSPGTARVELRWTGLGTNRYPVTTLSRRPIPGWAVGFLEEPAGIATAIIAGAEG